METSFSRHCRENVVITWEEKWIPVYLLFPILLTSYICTISYVHRLSSLWTFLLQSQCYWSPLPQTYFCSEQKRRRTVSYHLRWWRQSPRRWVVAPRWWRRDRDGSPVSMYAYRGYEWRIWGYMHMHNIADYGTFDNMQYHMHKLLHYTWYCISCPSSVLAEKKECI